LKPKIVVLASGSGSNFQSILNAIDRGEVNANVTRLIASRPSIGALEKATSAGIPTSVIQKSSFPNSEAFERSLLNEISMCNPDLIVLAGYLVQIPVDVIRAFENRIINIHPSLLPDFGGKGYYGLKVHEAVLASGKTETGCTVHLVTENYDEGPNLAQSRVPVFPDDTPDTLAKRVLDEEHKLLPKTIQSILKNLIP
jgi:formyltetrahydrofolate-dependent phosphoribosylglycinamide formyltransferase